MMQTLLDILSMAFSMTWEIFWALALGFLISAIVQSVVSRRQVAKHLPDASIGSIARASAFGAASSSCSYAAAAISRSLFVKGADFTAAIAFEFASTNLVVELSILLYLLLGWQFFAAEFLGGLVMIAILVLLFRLLLKPSTIARAKSEALAGRVGSMEGHAAMDMSITEGSLISRILSAKGFTAIAHSFFMDVASIWRDIVFGIIIASVLAVVVPSHAWQSFFLSGYHSTSTIWGAAIGPVVSMLSFVCSIGNIPIAALLWNQGISFAGVISFIFADLLILPIINIHRKYYGGKMTALLAIVSYIAMVLAGVIVEWIFAALHILPTVRHATVAPAMLTWNYTTFLDLAFVAVIVLLLVRFLRTGGPAMLRMMDAPEFPHEHHMHRGMHDHHTHHH